MDFLAGPQKSIITRLDCIGYIWGLLHWIPRRLFVIIDAVIL